MAGHDAGTTLHFYFPTKEAADACDIQNAVLYGGGYEFYDDNRTAVFDDLKKKLTIVYGDPAAEFTDPKEFWGKPAHREGMSDEDAERIYQETLERCSELSFAVWQQSGTDKQVVLVCFQERDGGWGRTYLYYFDTSADALIEQMYQQLGQGAEGAYSNSLDGL